jgi:lipopolysaccharide transport system permease protein
MTPVVYGEDMLPENYKYILYLNPMAPLIICWRRLFLGQSFEPNLLLFGFLYSLTIFLAGYSLFRKLSWRFAEVL